MELVCYIIFIVMMRTLSHRDVNCVAPSCTASKLPGQGSMPGSLVTDPRHFPGGQKYLTIKY